MTFCKNLHNQFAQQQLPFVTNIPNRNWIAQQAIWMMIYQDTALIDSSATLDTFWMMTDTSRFAYLNQVQLFIDSGNYSAALSLLSDTITYMIDTSVDSASGVMIADGLAADSIVQNYKEYYTLLIKYINDSMNGTDSINLVLLANMCPYVDGSIIYNARSLYSAVYNDLRMFSDAGCGSDTSGYSNNNNGGNNRIMPKHVNTDSTISKIISYKQGYSLFPNPNDGNFILQQSVANSGQVQLEINDVIGQSIDKLSVVFDNGIYKLQMPANTKPGIYFLQISDAANAKYNLKFVVE